MDNDKLNPTDTLRQNPPEEETADAGVPTAGAETNPAEATGISADPGTDLPASDADASADAGDETDAHHQTPVLSVETDKDEEDRKLWPEIKGWLRDLTFAVIICLVLIVYIAQPFRVEKTSMEPLLHDGDRILVSKISIRIAEIKRGDVVVLWNPRNVEESWIKRVIGLPGETVQIVDGTVYINGHALSEPYIPDEERNPPKNNFPSRDARMLVRQNPDEMEEFGMVLLDEDQNESGVPEALLIPEGYYFVCGDHRRFSMDSRDSVYPQGENGPGLIPKKYIYGKAFFRYWPLSGFGLIHHPEYPDFEAGGE